MSLYTYQNMAGQRFDLPERAIEPQEAAPLRYCARCGGEIYYGTDALCGDCRSVQATRKVSQNASQNHAV